MAFFTPSRMTRIAVSAYNQSKRAQARSAREAAAEYKAQQKLVEVHNGKQAVHSYEAYIAKLKGVHLTPVNEVDWEEVKRLPEPKMPLRQNYHELKARKELDDYKPDLLDKIFGRIERKRKNFQTALEKAKKDDEAAFNAAIGKYNAEVKEWRVLVQLAEGIGKREPLIYHQALQFLNPFEDLSEFGSDVTINLKPDHAIVDFKAKEASVVPDHVLSLTSTGKLSRKAMPKGKFNEIYQDYVCSCALRLANDLFALLPIKRVFVNVLSDQLDNSTGRLQLVPILSVCIVPETLERLEMATLDPSDSMRNFVHNMKFSKTNGFSPVSRVEM